MFANLGTTELIIILVILFVLFGSKKLVELARGLGESTKEVKKVAREIQGDGSSKPKAKKEDA